jgi:hypothetical protein
MRKLIRADGTEQEFDTPQHYSKIGPLIGAEVTDTVNLRHMGEPLHVMIVNDAQYKVADVQHSPSHFERVALAPLPGMVENVKATALYHANCQPGTTHKILGDVYVCPDDDFAGPDGL